MHLVESAAHGDGRQTAHGDPTQDRDNPHAKGVMSDPGPAPRRKSAFTLVRELIGGVRTLAGLEVRQARAEMAESLGHVKGGAVSFAIAAALVVMFVVMLLATIAMLPPAFARLRWLGGGGPPFAIGGTSLLVFICMAWDRRAQGHIHPAFLWGGGLLVLSLPLRFALARSDTWVDVARWLTR